MNRRTKEEQSNAGIGSALQGGGRPKVKRINTSFDEMLANSNYSAKGHGEVSSLK